MARDWDADQPVEVTAVRELPAGSVTINPDQSSREENDAGT